MALTAPPSMVTACTCVLLVTLLSLADHVLPARPSTASLVSRQAAVAQQGGVTTVTAPTYTRPSALTARTSSEGSGDEQAVVSPIDTKRDQIVSSGKVFTRARSEKNAIDTSLENPLSLYQSILGEPPHWAAKTDMSDTLQLTTKSRMHRDADDPRSLEKVEQLLSKGVIGDNISTATSQMFVVTKPSLINNATIKQLLNTYEERERLVSSQSARSFSPWKQSELTKPITNTETSQLVTRSSEPTSWVGMHVSDSVTVQNTPESGRPVENVLEGDSTRRNILDGDSTRRNILDGSRPTVRQPGRTEGVTLAGRVEAVGGAGNASGVANVSGWPVKLAAEVPGDLVLGGLMMVHEREDSVTCGPVMPQGGVQALETMLYTLDTVNRHPRLLPAVTIGAHILDDCDKDTYGLEMAVDFIKDHQ